MTTTRTRPIGRVAVAAAVMTTVMTATGSLTGAAQAATGTTTTYGTATAFQQDARHDGLAGGTALPTTLHQAWSRNFGAPASYPVIVGGRMFVTVQTPDVKAAAYGLDAATGRTVWGPVTLTGTYPFAALTYAGGRLFVVDNSGLLQALSPATGARLWSRQLPGQYSFSSTPVAADGLVFTGGAGIGGTVYAVDQRTGALVWTAPVANGDDSSPTIGTNSVFVSYACAFTYRFDLSGHQVWSRNDGCNGGGGRTSVLHGSTLWVRDPQGDLVLSTADGHVIRPFDSDTPPAFAGSRAVLLQGSTLTAVASGTGKALWSQTGDGQLDTAPVISGNTVYVGSFTGNVSGFDLTTGRQVWTANVGSSITGWEEFNPGIPQDLGIGGGYLVVPSAFTLTAFH